MVISLIRTGRILGHVAMDRVVCGVVMAVVDVRLG